MTTTTANHGFDPLGIELVFVVGISHDEVAAVGRALAGRAGCYFIEQRGSLPRPRNANNDATAPDALDDAAEQLRAMVDGSLRSVARGRNPSAAATDIIIAWPQGQAFIELLGIVFPAARFVIVVRNPVATLVGLFSEWADDESGRLEADAHAFVAMRAGFGALARAVVAGGDDAVVVRFEDFAAEPAVVCDRTLAAHGTSNGARPLQLAPIEDDDRWLEQAAREPLQPLALQLVDRLGDDLLLALGYDAERLRALCCGGAAALAARCECAERLAENGELDQAEAAFQAILDVSPDSVRALNGLGSALFGQLRLPAAVCAFERAVRAAPDDPAAVEHLAAALAATGRADEAERLRRRLDSCRERAAGSKRIAGRP